MSGRTAFLTSLLGQRWARERTCWHVAALVELRLFGRVLPHVEVPPDPSWDWMISTIASHPERENWNDVPPRHAGLVTAADGALACLGSLKRAAHIGVWLAPERRVIHCDPQLGVVAEDVATLRARGWARMQFFEPRD
ncbi:hypothetical protein KHC23_13080 [Ancylobacter dichloromethanicus]|uniref:NlpC/P60 domain-containing protein n=1 Tax=Ancylobacter dichloromethanicus TaxID=518825 RepID=A0A9W6J6L3_9HYPH|nr:hypothetical protein [Ancylobacter dichloromethanicus]MBS7554587.1 hypothetical protein [Ancylobacter dichloromethanicus]GLK71717.1 hypothetical protein GCM10017643_18320 [Ancylobacter dichloromethanicus]